MIGIGPFEIFLILAVLLIVVGPERMPEIVRFLARILREIRSAAAEMRDQVEHMAEIDEIRNEIGKETEQVRKSVEDVVPDDLRLIEPAAGEQRETDAPESDAVTASDQAGADGDAGSSDEAAETDTSTEQAVRRK